MALFCFVLLSLFGILILWLWSFHLHVSNKLGGHVLDKRQLASFQFWDWVHGSLRRRNHGTAFGFSLPPKVESHFGLLLDTKEQSPNLVANGDGVIQGWLKTLQSRPTKWKEWQNLMLVQNVWWHKRVRERERDVCVFVWI
jgi:hypothetical protein